MGTAAHLAAAMDWVVWQQAQCGLVLASLPGGLGSCMDWVVAPPCWPIASIDPDKESQTPVSGCQLGRNHEKTATLQVKKEAVYIFSGMNESIQPALFILVNVLWKLRNFHERVIFNVSSQPSESEESGMPTGPL